MESVISIGVLAVAVPMVLAGIGESSRTGEASGAETRAPWIAAACFDELRAASLGRSEYFQADSEGRVTPPNDGIWALGFTRGGRIVEMISAEDYFSGTGGIGDDAIRFIARMHSPQAGADAATGPTTVPAMRVTIEYPASAPEGRRRTLDFHAHIR